MKVFFLNNGTTHYYNLVLNRLTQVNGLDLTVVVPDRTSANIGDGVYQTREGVSFRVIELPEGKLLSRLSTFRGLAKLLFKERPEVIIFADSYLYTFVLNLPVVFARKLLGIRLIMKSIPFRVPGYDESLQQLSGRSAARRLLGRLNLALRRFAYQVPDAHVNYIDEARTIYGSYGVPAEKIFVTRNSPDTDLLFSVKETSRPSLPPNQHRIVHVGRLVEWKRVDMLLRALARVRTRFPGAELLVIGNGPEREKLEALAAQLKLGSSVTFLGGIYDPHVLGQYLLASSLYVLAGMGGLSINEAMCFGLPVLCSVGDGTEKIIVRDGVNGRFFKDGDEDDLVGKIEELFAHTGIMQAMGVQSERIIREEVNIHTVIDGYRRALSFALKGRQQVNAEGNSGI